MFSLTARLSRRFLADLTFSKEITVASIKQVGLSRPLLQGTARLLAPVL